MEKNYQLLILTPEKKIFEAEVVSLVAPGELGYLGILANHAPLLTTLAQGKIIIRDKNNLTTTFQINGGFLQIINNQATILTQTITL